MAYTHLLFESEQGVARITLNRPEVLNSFNRAMARELCEALATVAEDDGLRAVLLTGAGRGFCAGKDLAEASPRPDGSLPDLGDFVRQGYNLINWTNAGMNYWATSDLNLAELQEFVQLLQK